MGPGPRGCHLDATLGSPAGAAAAAHLAPPPHILHRCRTHPAFARRCLPVAAGGGGGGGGQRHDGEGEDGGRPYLLAAGDDARRRSLEVVATDVVGQPDGGAAAREA